ncbi:class I SAM-dependent methyltransferase [Planctomicrobium sp. SH664]|uniref:class I SAM-dependent methyltransferase n=1 Tax=Planctomicrobium sp. SH664 TaxID=3448125 RepID=UPI003F5B86A6
MCVVCQSAQFDSARADQFAERLLGILNSAGLALMISIGHRLGLFDALGRGEALTSAGLAERLQLNERYVREWLGALTTGGIVIYDPAQQTYSLPAEHAAFLVRSPGSLNIAASMQFIPILGQVEEQILNCFRNGGGVPYSEFPRFHEVMAEESEKTVVVALLDHILPLVPGMIGRLQEGIDVLDVGCGSGWALLKLAAAYPASRFAGYDFSAEAIAAAQSLADARGLKNIRFEQRDISQLDGSQQFDFITSFDVIHDQAEPAAVLASIRRSLRANGRYLMQDIKASSHLEKNLTHPLGPYLYTISCMHCMTVSLALNGAGLGTMWGEELAIRMLQEAGFELLGVHQLPHDLANSYYVSR